MQYAMRCEHSSSKCITELSAKSIVLAGHRTIPDPIYIYEPLHKSPLNAGGSLTCVNDVNEGFFPHWRKLVEVWRKFGGRENNMKIMGGFRKTLSTKMHRISRWIWLQFRRPLPHFKPEKQSFLLG